jgi:lipopolysaccharide transport system permease protein
VRSSHLITKVYFPRLIIPMAGVLSGLVDFAIAFLVLIGLMAYYGVVPTWASLLLPLFLMLSMLTALGFGTWLSALNVRYRDINYLIPFLIQVWMYLTPVIYGSTIIPEPFRPLLGLNPMTGVVEGFRWALLGNRLADARPPGVLFAVSIGVTLLVLVSGILFFQRTEDTFADII